MTERKAWEEATEDARRTLRGHIDTIDEQNRHAYNVLRLNAVLIAALAAVVYRFPLRSVEFYFIIIGGGAITVASFVCIGLLRSGGVSIGVPPPIYEDLERFEVSANQYYRHVTGVIYPEAIRDARAHSDRYSDRLNAVYAIMAFGIAVLGIGALYGYLCA